MRIVFMGTPAFAVPSFEALMRSHYQVVGVVTQPDRPKGRGHAVIPPPVKQVAQAHRLPILQPEKMKNPGFLDQLTHWQPDLIAVTAFGRILPKVILDLPPRGCVNVHASLLPRYRGAAPIQWALINGDTEAGATTMLLDEGMDTGPILLQETVPIEPTDTAAELSARLADMGGGLLVQTLHELEAGTLTPRVQEDAYATLAPLLKKEEGNINWTLAAEQIANRVRGLSPWPGSYTFLNEERLTIWRAHPLKGPMGSGQAAHSPGTVVEVGKNDIFVVTGHGVLVITEVQPANRKRMPVDQFLMGYRLESGALFRAEPHPK